jgi:hypothetical protein
LPFKNIIIGSTKSLTAPWFLYLELRINMSTVV